MPSQGNNLKSVQRSFNQGNERFELLTTVQRSGHVNQRNERFELLTTVQRSFNQTNVD